MVMMIIQFHFDRVFFGFIFFGFLFSENKQLSHLAFDILRYISVTNSKQNLNLPRWVEQERYEDSTLYAILPFILHIVNFFFLLL